MQFGIRDRFVLLGLLPSEGSFADILIIRDLRKALSFTEEEHAVFGFKFVGEGEKQQVMWDEKKEQPKEIEIGPRAHTLIADLLKKLYDSNKMKDEHIELYQAFWPEKK